MSTVGRVLVAMVAVAAMVLAGSAECRAEKTSYDEIVRIAASLKYQDGEIDLGHGLAKLSLPASYRYLSPDDAEKVLVKLWDNPPSETKSLGLIIPANMSPLEDDCWVTTIYWVEDGYVRDDDAEKIDYDDLLKTMQEATRERNAQRIKDGYDSLDLVGWALPPRYERESHKYYWAKELKSGSMEEHSLNYSIRILGRRGYLTLNAIAGMSQLKTVTDATPELLQMIDFTPGNRYTDFQSGKDHVAEYGLGAMVAGGIAAKAGFFKVLWVGILAAKKFVVLGLIALVALLRKYGGGIFDRIRGRKE